MTQPVEIYFFGCRNEEGGHYLFDPHMRTRWEKIEALPWGWTIDGGLAPGGGVRIGRRPEIEGHAALHHKDGWTALAWWDRSVDKRGACNAGLYANGTFTAEEMLVLGREHFPQIMARFKYMITTDVT